MIYIPEILKHNQPIAYLFLVDSLSQANSIHNYESITFVVGGHIRSLMAKEHRKVH